MSERALGRYEAACYARHARDLALCASKTGHPKGFRYSESLGQHAVDFLEQNCRHHKGEWAGQPLKLEEWQKTVVRILFGWQKPEIGPDGTETGRFVRRFSIGYIEIPRK